MADSPPKRLQSQTERDMAGLAARRDRHRSAPGGIPEVHVDEVTGNYEGEELARMRSRRPTPERLRILEAKHDSLSGSVNAIRVDVAEMRGEMKALPKMLELLEGKQAAAVTANTNEHETKRLGMANRTKIILGVLSLLGSGGIGAIIAALSGCAS